MDLFSQEIERSKLKEGDHIYAWRNLYTHHGIFVGEDKIIHFVNPKREGGNHGLLARFGISSSNGGGNGENKQKIHCKTRYCHSEKVVGSGVQLSCIDCFIKQGQLHRFKYNVTREFLLAKSVGGTCTMAESDTPEEVIHRATYLYENGYGKYDLMNNNCEDFALYCTTGLWSTDKGYQGRSSQANMVHSSNKQGNKGKSNVETALRYATAIPRAFSKRENKDLGYRKDVVKVPVEELSSFILSVTSSQ